MVLTPMSYYPMPADSASQAQVLQEEKTELSSKAQTVEESTMSGPDKQRILNETNQKINAVNVQIRKKKQEQNVEERSENKRLLKKSDQEKQSEKQLIAAENRKQDNEIESSEKIERAKKALDIRV